MDWETLLSDIQSNELRDSQVENHTNLLNLKSDNARLIIEIDRLSSELDATVRDKGRGLNKIDTLEQTLTNYKRKCKELINALDALEKFCGRCHSDFTYYRDKHEKCLSEVQDLKNDRKDLLQDLKNLSTEMKQIEDERNSALETAEQIQQSFIELRNQYDIKLKQSEFQISEIAKERESLISTCEHMRLESSKIQAELNHAHSELQLQASHYKRLETQQKDFINQNRLKTQELKTLKNDLMKFNEMKRDNKRIAIYNCELRRRAERCEEEMKSMKDQYEQFDEAIESLNKNKSKKSNHRIEIDGPLSKSLNCLVEHLRDVENERKWNKELISNLESKVSNLQFNKTSMEHQLLQKSAQVSELNRQIKEISSEDRVSENEFQTRSQQIEVLKSQLNEMDIIIKESQTKFQHIEYLLQLENENKIVLENELVVTKQQLGEKSAALKDAMAREKLLQESIEMTRTGLEASEENFTRSEKRCNSLQASLDEIVEATRFLKAEIQQSDETKQQYISTLETQLREKSTECDSLKTELITVEDKLIEKNNVQAEANSIKFKNDLELREKQIKSLENDLDAMSSLKLGLEKQMDDLKKEMIGRETTIENNIKQIRHLEETNEKLSEELKTSENIKNKEMGLLNQTLGHLKEKLRTSSETLSLKDGTILLLTEEKSQAKDNEKETIRTFRTEIDNILKDLKDERKKNMKLRAEHGELLQGNEELVSSLKTLKLSHESLKDDMSSLEFKYNSEKKKIRSLEGRAGELLSTLKINDSKMKSYKNESHAYKKEVYILKEELQNFKTADDENISENIMNRLKIQNLGEVLEKARSELENKSSLLTQMEADAKEQEYQLTTRTRSFEKQLKIILDETMTKENLNAALEGQINQLSESLKESLGSRQSIVNKCKLLKEEMHKSKEITENLEKKLYGMEEDKQRVVANMSKVECQLDIYKSKCDVLYHELSNIKEEYFSAKQYNLEIMTELQEKKTQLNSQDQEIKQFKELMESLSHENIEKERRFLLVEGSLKLQADKSKAELLEMKQEKSIRLEEIDQLKKKIRSLEIQLHKLTQELNRITSDLSATRTELEANKVVLNANRESLLVKDLEVKKLSSKIDKVRDQSKTNSTEISLPENPSLIVSGTKLRYPDNLLQSMDTETSSLPTDLIGELFNMNRLFEEISNTKTNFQDLLPDYKSPLPCDHVQSIEKARVNEQPVQQKSTLKMAQQNGQIKPKWR